MYRLAGLLVLLAVIPVPLTAGDKNADHDKMQGRWQLVDAKDSDGLFKKGGFAKHVMVIKGDKMIEEAEAGGKETAQPFQLMPGKDPKWIDFRTGGDGKEGQNRVGIYVIEGDSLKICFSSVAPAQEIHRPTSFTTPPGNGWVLLVYKRLKN